MASKLKHLKKEMGIEKFRQHFIEKYNELGNQTLLAEYFGVSQGTISLEFQRLGLTWSRGIAQQDARYALSEIAETF